MLYFFTAITLAYNFVCTLMAVFVADTSGNTTAAGFFAAIYAVLGIPGAWLLWCASDPPPLVSSSSAHRIYKSCRCTLSYKGVRYSDMVSKPPRSLRHVQACMQEPTRAAAGAGTSGCTAR